MDKLKKLFSNFWSFISKDRFSNEVFYKDKKISFREIVEQIPGNVYIKDKNGDFIYCNKQNLSNFQMHSLSDFVGRNDHDLMSFEEAENTRKIDLKVIQGEEPIAIEENATINGKTFSYLSHKSPLKTKDNELIGLIGVSLEITERLELLENIIARMPGHVYWVDKNNVYLGCNNNQAISSGLRSRKDILGKRNKDLPWNFNAGTLPEKLDQINEEVMQTGKEVLLQEPATLQDGTKAIFLSNKAPLYNSKGSIIGMVGISVDITEKKKTEQELLETHHKAQGMALVGASIAHELRTPLTTLKFAVNNVNSDFSELLKIKNIFPPSNLDEAQQQSTTQLINSIKETFEAMNREINLSALVIDLLLENLKPEANTKAKEQFSIVDCISNALNRYPFTDNQRKIIFWEPHFDFFVEGSKLSLIHVIFNLIKNALYFIAKADKGEIIIHLQQGVPYNYLLFKDTGTGITPKDLPHIFERFFSKTEHGAGIGLAWCKMAIESLGGNIQCESVESEYTVFKIGLPTLEEISKQ